MIKIALDRPVKIVFKTKEDEKFDYETVGKLLDNMIVLCSQDNLPLNKVGKVYYCEFVVGKKVKYGAELKIEKTMCVLTISYKKELTKYESTRPFAIPPKEKMLIKEAEKMAKEQMEEKKKKDKEKKASKKKESK